MTEAPTNRFSPASPKRNAPNVSGGWIVMILAFLIAVAIYFYLTQQQSQQFPIAVATQDIAPGDKVSPSSFKQIDVNLPKDVLAKIVSFDQIMAVNGYVASAKIASGDPVLKSALIAPATADGLRSMSVPVDKDRAVGGAITVGDRVDIVDTTQNFANGFAARDLTVLAVNNGGGTGALTTGGGYSLTVAVNTTDAINIAMAIDKNKFLVLKSTGASPIIGTPTTPLPATSTTVHK